MKELGGYFGLEQLISNEYYKGLAPLNNARNALLCILRNRKIRKLYIPRYLCNSVKDMLIKYNYDFEYYNIDFAFMPVFNKSLLSDEYLYIVNYYGQLLNDKISYLKQLYGQIILDNSHAFFQKPFMGVDTIYNCRKFFGVPDGAYLFTDIVIKEDLEIDVSKDRMKHILGRNEGLASEYYNDFKNNDEAFEREPPKYMSKLTHNILGAIDYERVRKIRNENYAYLEYKLGAVNKLKLVTSDGSFAYPFYIDNGPEIRQILVKKRIYIPTLWPNVIDSEAKHSIEYMYSANILPLTCDQRYGIEDMDYIIKNLSEVL